MDAVFPTLLMFGGGQHVTNVHTHICAVSRGYVRPGSFNVITINRKLLNASHTDSWVNATGY